MKTKMRKCRVKKLFQGHASVRDYLVENAILNGQGLEIHYEHHVMTVPIEQLVHTFQFHKQSFQSRFVARKYMLIDFTFVSDELRKEYVAEN